MLWELGIEHRRQQLAPAPLACVSAGPEGGWEDPVPPPPQVCVLPFSCRSYILSQLAQDSPETGAYLYTCKILQSKIAFTLIPWLSMLWELKFTAPSYHPTSESRILNLVSFPGTHKQALYYFKPSTSLCFAALNVFVFYFKGRVKERATGGCWLALAFLG